MPAVVNPYSPVSGLSHSRRPESWVQDPEVEHQAEGPRLPGPLRTGELHPSLHEGGGP